MGKDLGMTGGGVPSTIFVGIPSGEKLAGFELVTWSTARWQGLGEFSVFREARANESFCRGVDQLCG